MTTKDFTATILVKKTTSEVFQAINNVRGWWQGEIHGSSGKLHDEFEYRMGDLHFSKQKVIEVIPDKKIVWHVTDSNLTFINDKEEWTDSKIVFEISEKKTESGATLTHVKFTHHGLTSACECYDACSYGWQQLLQVSLISFINTGKGEDVF